MKCLVPALYERGIKLERLLVGFNKSSLKIIGDIINDSTSCRVSLRKDELEEDGEVGAEGSCEEGPS
eukprot:CAMPEP_0196573856 /NCGR_PEP_ID=MMETSP1081-20130531/3684_1 /TAXON_ID=36882 /ORGANISM="Pyramimonas amylifera, Strain CCMP720" /LENGTH=66 /DNA_ID=CAMNT_0041891695 /DNA_START=145 /DNA_END=342 /DNA_ORIENTATION=+